MHGETINLMLTNLGLYNLQIMDPRGALVMQATNISLDRAIAMIRSREEKTVSER